MVPRLAADQEAAKHHVLDRIGRAGEPRELEVEVVERPRIVVARSPGEAVRHREFHGSVAPQHRGRELRVRVRIDRRAQSNLPRRRRCAVGQARSKAIAERATADSSRRRDHECEILVKPTGECAAVVLEHEIRHPVQGLAEQASRLAGGDEIVDRRRRGFSGHLPGKAAHVRVGQRSPEAETGRSRPRVHRRALVGMPELVHVEWILIVNPPLLAEMVPCRGERRREDLLAILGLVRVGDAIVAVHRRQKHRELERRNQITLVAARIRDLSRRGNGRGDERDKDRPWSDVMQCASLVRRCRRRTEERRPRRHQPSLQIRRPVQAPGRPLQAPLACGRAMCDGNRKGRRSAPSPCHLQRPRSTDAVQPEDTRKNAA